MKPRIGDWVRYVDSDGAAYAALILERHLIRAVGVEENDFRLTLEVHNVNRSEPNERMYVTMPSVRLVEDVRFSRSPTQSCWSWP